eukprot:Clim_evm21s231 gene=Clim_evmTU21s231
MEMNVDFSAYRTMREMRHIQPGMGHCAVAERKQVRNSLPRPAKPGRSMSEKGMIVKEPIHRQSSAPQNASFLDTGDYCPFISQVMDNPEISLEDQDISAIAEWLMDPQMMNVLKMVSGGETKSIPVPAQLLLCRACHGVKVSRTSTSPTPRKSRIFRSSENDEVMLTTRGSCPSLTSDVFSSISSVDEGYGSSREGYGSPRSSLNNLRHSYGSGSVSSRRSRVFRISSSSDAGLLSPRRSLSRSNSQADEDVDPINICINALRHAMKPAQILQTLTMFAEQGCPSMRYLDEEAMKDISLHCGGGDRPLDRLREGIADLLTAWIRHAWFDFMPVDADSNAPNQLTEELEKTIQALSDNGIADVKVREIYHAMNRAKREYAAMSRQAYSEPERGIIGQLSAETAGDLLEVATNDENSVHSSSSNSSISYDDTDKNSEPLPPVPQHVIEGIDNIVLTGCPELNAQARRQQKMLASGIDAHDRGLLAAVVPTGALLSVWKKDHTDHQRRVATFAIDRYTTWFNSLSHWTSIRCLVAVSNPKVLKDVYEALVAVADDLLKLGNYNAAFAMYTGLGHSRVQSQVSKMGDIRSKTREQMSRMEALFTPTRNFRALRKDMAKRRDKNYVPILAILIHDVTYLNEMRTDYLDGKVVNVTKLHTMSEICEKIRRHQDVPPHALSRLDLTDAMLPHLKLSGTGCPESVAEYINERVVGMEHVSVSAVGKFFAASERDMRQMAQMNEQKAHA